LNRVVNLSFMYLIKWCNISNYRHFVSLLCYIIALSRDIAIDSCVSRVCVCARARDYASPMERFWEIWWNSPWPLRKVQYRMQVFLETLMWIRNMKFHLNLSSPWFSHHFCYSYYWHTIIKYVTDSRHSTKKMHKIIPWIFVLNYRTYHSYMFRPPETFIRESNQSSTTWNEISHFCTQRTWCKKSDS